MTTDMLWLEVTGKCQLTCGHCYASSGPNGQHTRLTPEEWERTVNQAAAHGVQHVQMIGGEPTLWPGLASLVSHTREKGLNVEIFSNLVHVTRDQWEVFSRPGVSLATSWYSDEPAEHEAITGRPTHARTLSNIKTAVERGIPLRVGIVKVKDDQRCTAARALLERIGVQTITLDRMRQLGRGRTPDVSELCGHCGHGVAAVGPDGQVWPCVMSRWIPIGNVRHESLPAILERMPTAVQGVTPAQDACAPKCGPNCSPMENCLPKKACSPNGHA